MDGIDVNVQTPARLLNTHDQLVAAGGGVAIIVAHSPGRSRSPCGWSVYRIVDGKQVITDKIAAWYERGMKTFHYGTTKMEAFEAAKAWVAEKYGESGPWHRNVMRDYVPERIAKKFPIRKAPRPKT